MSKNSINTTFRSFHKEIYIILKNIKSIVWSVVQTTKNILIDSHLNAYGTPQANFFRLIKRTWRYKLAARGIYLSDNEKKLSFYRDKHKGERAFIIGNGPSLNNCDLTLLKNEITFGVNAIYLNYDKMGFYPTYYVVEDIFVAEDRSEEINALKGPIKFFGNYLKYCLQDSSDVMWMNVRFRYDDYPCFPYFSKNALRMLWTGGTVSYLSMQLAYYMGFSEICLIGFDHSYVIPDNAIIKKTKITSVSNDTNHFHPGYFGKGYRWHDPMVDRMEQAYRKTKKIFEQDGRKIFNATVNGNLEIFDRVNFQDLFK